MKVLVVGSGGREHALAWICSRASDVEQVWCAPGNGGTRDVAETLAISATDATAIADAATENAVDLVVVGPETALAAGVADACNAAGIAVFGPSAAAAQIESSKEFAKQLMDDAGVPTARWTAGGVGDREMLTAFVRDLGGECVVKADGLAAGKGVTVCNGVAEAEAAIAACFDDARFGAAGDRLIVEEKLSGREVSVFALCDGTFAHLLPPACDYKRAFDGDTGPNTGGMGAYSPPHDLDVAELLDATQRDVVAPILAALRSKGIPFVGCLYAGLMLTLDGLRVIEFNARFGDPETEVLMPLLDPGRFVQLLASCAQGTLPGNGRELVQQAAVTVVAAAGNYPGTVTTGDAISLPGALAEHVAIFHAGTTVDADGTLRTAGGRVLTVTGVGADVASARTRAFEAIAGVHFEGMRFRSDIGSPAAVSYSARS